MISILANYAGIVSALLALLVAVSAWSKASKTAYLNTVTAARAKWITSLRDHTSDYIEKIYDLHAKDHLRGLSVTKVTQSEQELSSKINMLDAQIKLMLSPNDFFKRKTTNISDNFAEANVVKYIDAISSHIGVQDKLNYKEKYDLNELVGFLVPHVQFLLKEAWEDIKFEATPSCEHWALNEKRTERKLAYDKFCEEKDYLLNKRKWLATNNRPKTTT